MLGDWTLDGTVSAGALEQTRRGRNSQRRRHRCEADAHGKGALQGSPPQRAPAPMTCGPLKGQRLSQSRLCIPGSQVVLAGLRRGTVFATSSRKHCK